MKKIIFPLIVTLIAFNSNAQILQIGVGIGSTIVTAHDFYTNDLTGTIYQKSITSPYSLVVLDGLDFNSEYNMAIKARLLKNNNPLNYYCEISFNRLIGKGIIHFDTSPESSYLPPPRKSESKCNLISISLGAEYKILNRGINPFLSAGIIISHLGDIHIQTIEDELYNYNCIATKGGMRYGLNFGVGFHYKIYKKFFFEISSNYSMNNLLGRESSEKYLNTIRPNINILYEL